MEHLPLVVRRVTGRETDLEKLGLEITSTWNALESQASAVGYDVLGRGNSSVRTTTVALVQLLYQVPGATGEADVAQLRTKDAEYGGSWCKRGGTGAFHMAARKADRIVHQLEKFNGRLDMALMDDSREEGILDDFGDLRRYLLLWLSWHDAEATDADPR